MDPANLLTGLRIALSIYHMPSLPMIPKLSNRVRPVAVASTLPIGAYIRPLSLKDSHSIYLKSHLRVSNVFGLISVPRTLRINIFHPRTSKNQCFVSPDY